MPRPAVAAADQSRFVCCDRARGRHAGAFFAILLLCGVASCAKPPTQPEPVTDPVLRPIVDDSPTWSHDGRWVAYHRRFSSAHGPAGVYVVSSFGGEPRLLVAGSLTGPWDLSFSPDGRQLVGSWGGQLVFIDVASGVLRRPLYTNNCAVKPDWSPDGMVVVYARRCLDPGEPADSAGLHVFDTSTGTDHLLGDALNGTHPRWSRDGREIVFTDYTGIATIQSDGTQFRTIAPPPPGHLLDDPQWYDDQITGSHAILFRRSSGSERVTYWVRPNGAGLRRWYPSLGPYDAVSPDGSQIVVVMPDPRYPVAVLFVARTEDVTGARRRQLTSWEPPAPSSSGVGSSDDSAP